MTRRSWFHCECRGGQADGKGCAHGTKRCRRRATLELRQARSRGGWWHFCVGCADAIQGPGSLANECERRELVEAAS